MHFVPTAQLCEFNSKSQTACAIRTAASSYIWPGHLPTSGDASTNFQVTVFKIGQLFELCISYQQHSFANSTPNHKRLAPFEPPHQVTSGQAICRRLETLLQTSKLQFLK